MNLLILLERILDQKLRFWVLFYFDSINYIFAVQHVLLQFKRHEFFSTFTTLFKFRSQIVYLMVFFGTDLLVTFVSLKRFRLCYFLRWNRFYFMFTYIILIRTFYNRFFNLNLLINNLFVSTFTNWFMFTYPVLSKFPATFGTCSPNQILLVLVLFKLIIIVLDLLISVLNSLRILFQTKLKLFLLLFDSMN